MAAISIRLDDETKQRFDEFCNSVGMSVSTAFNLFAKTVVREQRIPFEIKSDIPTQRLMQAFKEAEAIASDPDSPGYTDINKMMEDILSVAEQEPEYKV